MSKLVAFDVDGTLLNSFIRFGELIQEYSNINNLPPTCIEAFQNGYANPDAYDFGWGVSKEEQRIHLEKLIKFCEVNVNSRMPDLFVGAEDTLVNLKDNGNTLAIITARPEKEVVEVLEHHNVYTLFSAHRYKCDVARRGEKRKPYPDMLDSVMRDLNFAPDETVMIGDTDMDIEMGRNANAGTIGVTWGAHSKEMLEKANAHYIVETEVSDIVPVIGREF